MEQNLSLARSLLTQLQCVILPAKNVPKAADYYYDAVYRFWHENWFNNLKTDSKDVCPEILYSDDFRRQDTIVSLFHHSQPIGLHITDHMNLNYLSARQHSCLKQYPDALIEDLIASNKFHIITWGNFVVAQSWRKHQNNLPISHVFPGVGKKLLLKSAAACVTCITRDDRNVNILLSKHGFRAHNQLFSHGREASIMILDRADVKDVGEYEIDDMINYLWKNRLDFSKDHTTNLESVV